MKIFLVSNFDITQLDLKIIENINLSSFNKILFPRSSPEDLNDLIENKINKELYKLSKLDKIYNFCIPNLSYSFHNLNDFIYNMLSNIEYASRDYWEKETKENFLELGNEIKIINKNSRKILKNKTINNL